MKIDNAIIEWNKTDRELHGAETLISGFIDQVAKTPDNTAVIDRSGTYSYEATHLASIKIANSLYLSGNHQLNQVIAVFSVKGYLQVVSLLGVMAAGFAYLPLHPNWPLGRIEEILKLSGVRIILIDEESYQHLILGSSLVNEFTWLIIDQILSKENDADLKLPTILPDQLAYIIFTSGSTGKPKGVAIQHQSAANTIKAVNNEFHINQNDVIFAISELSFDLSVYDLFGMFYVGATLVFPLHNGELIDPGAWYDTIIRYKITIWNSVPQLLHVLAEYILREKKSLTTLRLALLSGDWLPVNLPSKIRTLNESITVISLGGVTEASIWSVWYEVKQIDPIWNSIPYGLPMPNQKVYILDELGKHCPIGVEGEIYIGGKGLALGYWKDAEKTKSSFWNHNTLGRIYKTGDRGIWHVKGYIEFRGRRDHQIKLNGYRIELGEISSLLLNFKGVSQAIVVVKQQQLLAYTIIDKTLFDLELCKSYLAHHLPQYMLPHEFIFIDEIPLTENGKISYDLLPNVQKKVEHFPPKTETHQLLCDIFITSLGVRTIGIKDDFFHLGGDSLKAIEICTLLREKNINVRPLDLFKYRTIEDIANNIDEFSDSLDSQSNYYLPFTISTSQFLYWFSYMKGDREVLEINLPRDLNLELLKMAITRVSKKQAVFHLQVYKHRPLQKYVSGKQLFNFKHIPHNLSGKFSFENQDFLLRSSKNDKVHPPNFYFYLLEKTPGSYSLYFVVNHLLVDGYTTQVFVNQLRDEYYQEFNQKIMPNTYIYARAINDYFELIKNEEVSLRKNLKEDYLFWKKFHHNDSVVKVPMHLIASSRQIKKNYQLHYDKLISNEDLHLISQQFGGVEKVPYVLMYAFILALFPELNQEIYCIQNVTSGREFTNLAHVMGMFTNLQSIKVKNNKPQLSFKTCISALYDASIQVKRYSAAPALVKLKFFLESQYQGSWSFKWLRKIIRWPVKYKLRKSIFRNEIFESTITVLTSVIIRKVKHQFLSLYKYLVKFYPLEIYFDILPSTARTNKDSGDFTIALNKEKYNALWKPNAMIVLFESDSQNTYFTINSALTLSYRQLISKRFIQILQQIKMTSGGVSIGELLDRDSPL